MESYYDTEILDCENIKIDNYSFILLASRRKSGKSVLVKGLIKNICDNFEIDYIIIFSKTSLYNNDYDFLDKKYHYDYDESEKIITKIIDYQKKKLKNKSKNEK